MAISFQVQKCRKWQETTREKVTGVPQQLWVEQIRRQIATKSPKRPANTQDSLQNREQSPKLNEANSEARMRQLDRSFSPKWKPKLLAKQSKGRGKRGSGAWCRDYNLDTGKQWNWQRLSFGRSSVQPFSGYLLRILRGAVALSILKVGSVAATELTGLSGKWKVP